MLNEGSLSGSQQSPLKYYA